MVVPVSVEARVCVEVAAQLRLRLRLRLPNIWGVVLTV